MLNCRREAARSLRALSRLCWEGFTSALCGAFVDAPEVVGSLRLWRYLGSSWQKLAQVLSPEREHSHLPGDLLRRRGGLPRP